MTIVLVIVITAVIMLVALVRGDHGAQRHY